ncbi:tRNA epoxyqueuosine(34) reductase QueG [Oricola thermophila]|uniref:tRNA epoxyqueuosine(34) reductase QueG n=1 Tax=Oricola thermophila TaxID=2742145 RepID=A0A6N1VIH2_9HYPH|nr:tRNA epoxyqueuosine(34) reductase QueG [Oricola thermophila]QKV20691.1 tRNA epoxyqueuosine(34) reductase QueG [Oricola thermophila]
MNPEKAKTFLTEDLGKEGFADVRIARADSIPQAAGRLRTFLAAGRHGTMGWMAETEERRGNPQKLWPEARTVVLAAMEYGPEDGNEPLAALERRDRGTISVYARNRDYHDVVKGKLKQAAGRFAAKTGEQVKVFVDTAPVMEKPLGAAAGLGWQGKHTNLVSRRLGSWFFIGAIFTTADLPPDEAETDHCGSCRACLDICPTDAFPAPYQLDARRCISYLTIEHAGPIPEEFRPAMGNRIYGCDDCLAACPWNKFAGAAREAKLKARDDLKSPAICDLLMLDDAKFRAMFSGSPIKRIGRNRFIRNVLIAAGNSGKAELAGDVAPHLEDPDPVVRETAHWALDRLKSAVQIKDLNSKAALTEGENSATQNRRKKSP